MPYEITDEDRLRDVTRLHNRALRTLSKNIRHKLERVQKESDEVIAALFDAPSEASLALAEIHSKLQLECDPLDYGAIVALVTSL